MQDGWKETELASKLGRTPSWVSERLSELRTEILLQNGLFPPLTDAEEAALRDSIRVKGVLHPVLVDEELEVIDGRNRLRISNELGLACPFWILRQVTAGEKREIAIELNASRRQLNRQQKRKIIEHELMYDGSRSDRRIAAICGVTHPTVATVRAEIIAASDRWQELQLPLSDAPNAPPIVADETSVELSTPPIWARADVLEAAVSTRKDTLGRRQPVRRAHPPRVSVPKVVATVDCPCCGEQLDILREAGTLRLERHP